MRAFAQIENVARLCTQQLKANGIDKAYTVENSDGETPYTVYMQDASGETVRSIATGGLQYCSSRVNADTLREIIAKQAAELEVFRRYVAMVGGDLRDKVSQELAEL